MNYLFLAQLNITEVLIVVAIMAVLAVVFTILMVTVSKICHVEEDKTVEVIADEAGTVVITDAVVEEF